MAKVKVTLKDGTKYTFESQFDDDHLDFTYNYDETKENRVQKSTNSRRLNQASAAIVDVLSYVPGQVDENGEPTGLSFYDGFTENGRIFIAADQIRSIELGD